ncbi:MAG: potassium/proton antiporter, partial [Lentisphaeria bacterium]
MEQKILLTGLLIFISIYAMRLTKKFRIPLLVIFLFIGMIAGSEGLGGIEFDNAAVTQNIGELALLFIIFTSGIETEKSNIKSVLYPSLFLSTIGVLFTALLGGLVIYFLLDFSIWQSMLFGAMISSTDAAAVMSMLGQERLNKKVKSLIEAESGSNDPMAYALLLIMFSGLKGEFSITSGIFFLALQLLLGASLGYFFGHFTIPLTNHLKIVREEFLCLIVIALLFICYGSSKIIQGNGYLAAYIMGITIGNLRFNFRINTIRSMRLITWFMQIFMFVILGLLVFPSQAIKFIIPGSILAIAICLIVRFIVIFSIMPFFKNFSLKENLFIAFAGLKGAVPIIFATMAITEKIPQSNSIF